MEWTPIERLFLQFGVLGPAPLTPVVTPHRHESTASDFQPDERHRKDFKLGNGLLLAAGAQPARRLLTFTRQWSCWEQHTTTRPRAFLERGSSIGSTTGE